MRLDYELTNADFIAFNEFMYTVSPGLVRTIHRNRVLLTALTFVAGAVIMFGSDVPLLWLVVTIAAAAASWVLGPKLLLRSVSGQLKLMAESGPLGHCGPVVLTWDQSWVVEDGPGWRTTMAWQRIARVEESEHHVFLVVGEIEALIVPKRAGAHVTELVRQAREQMAAR